MQNKLLALTAACVLSLWGCGSKPEDEVLAQYTRGEEGIASGNSLEVRDTMTTESLQHYEEAKRLALVCPEKEAKKLSPCMLETVLAMRNRLTPEKLRSLTPEQTIQWMIDSGQYAVDKDAGIVPYKVTISGELATIQMGVEVESNARVRPRFRRRSGSAAAVGALISAAAGPDVEPIPGFFYTFRKINGFWYFDLIATEPQQDAMITGLAAEDGVTVTDLLEKHERDAFGSLKEKIWAPVGK